jgi:hypothetical protein
MGIDLNLLAEYKNKKKWCMAVPPESLRDISLDEYFFFGRNYYLFDILGYYEHPRVGGPTSIYPRRGLPNNISKECYNIMQTSCCYSYLYLYELKEFNWYKEFFIIKKNTLPKKIFCDSPVLEIINSNDECEIKTYAEAAGDFYSKVIPALEELSKKYGGDRNVRIIYGFG